MTKQQVENAERRALNEFDKWNDVTGVFDVNSGYYSEILSVIEDSVHIGIQMALFGIKEPEIISGAEFSECGKYRYALWREWGSQCKVAFIGLNPSTANATTNDHTINRVCAIAKHNGYGGVYMLNCFPYISTNPKELYDCGNYNENREWILKASAMCSEIVFAWGNFKIVTDEHMDAELIRLFPNAKALHINKNGSPKHPLYCKVNSKLIPYKKQIQ